MKGFSAGLLISLLIVAGSGAQTGGGEGKALASSASDTVPIITPERLKTVADFALTNSETVPIPDRITAPLGLVAPGTPFMSKQVGHRDADGTTHVLAVETASSPRIFIARSVSKTKTGVFFSCDRQGNLMAAVKVEKGAVVVLDIQDSVVIADFHHELKLWAETRLSAPPNGG